MILGYSAKGADDLEAVEAPGSQNKNEPQGGIEVVQDLDEAAGEAVPGPSKKRPRCPLESLEKNDAVLVKCNNQPWWPGFFLRRDTDGYYYIAVRFEDSWTTLKKVNSKIYIKHSIKL